MRFAIALSIALTAFAQELTLGDFAPYVKAFVEAARKYQLPMTKPIRIEDLVVEFGDMPPSDVPHTKTEGYCVEREDETPIVRLGKKSWNEATETGREMILFHELGHCVLHRDHKETFIKIDGAQIPASLMVPALFDEKAYAKNRDYYLQELFMTRERQ